MPVFEDWLKNPLSIVNNIFASDPVNFDRKVQEYFEEKLKLEKNYYSIPSLNEIPIHELTTNCLVRYRCMIQDSFDPVYFTGVHQIKNKANNETEFITFKYKENLDCPDGFEPCTDLNRANQTNNFEKLNSSINLTNVPTNLNELKENQENFTKNENENLYQRMTFYCVPIPGETEWVKEIYKSNSLFNSSGSSSSSSHRPLKRTIDENQEDNNTATTTMADSESVSKIEQSKDNNSNELIETTNDPKADYDMICTETNTNICNVCLKYKINGTNSSKIVNICKKTKIEEIDEKKIHFKNDFNLNFPLASNENGIPCLVKVYENFESYKINDIIEFVGILSQDPSLAYMYDEHDDSIYLNGHADQITETHKTIIEKTVEKIEKISMDTEEPNEKCQEIDENNSTLCSCTKTTTNTHSKKSKVVLSSFPPSLVPRLHCIKSSHLLHNNPLLNKIHFKENLKANSSKFDCSTENETTENKENFINEYWSKQMKHFLVNLVYDQNDSKMNPNTSQTSPTIDLALFENSPNSNSMIQLVKLRQEIIYIFQEMLLGDSLAAEYLLMNLISFVFMRKDVTILGKFALNLTNIPQAFIQAASTASKTSTTSHKSSDDIKIVKHEPNKHFSECFYNALNRFVSMSHLYRLTVDNLNKSNLIPNKDYFKDKLITGMLQLPEGFHLVIDETILNSGELNQKGLMNFNSIKDIIKWQKLNYDFSYHQQEFPTNMRVLILSQTKSILPFDCQLKLNPNTQRFDAESYESYISDLLDNKESKLMNKFRNYLSVVAKLDYKITQSMQKIVEDDIVNIRKCFMSANGINNNLDNQIANGINAEQKEKITMSIDDIHLLLIVARLQSLSNGKSELGLNEWNRAKALEYERLHTRI